MQQQRSFYLITITQAQQSSKRDERSEGVVMRERMGVKMRERENKDVEEQREKLNGEWQRGIKTTTSTPHPPTPTMASSKE